MHQYYQALNHAAPSTLNKLIDIGFITDGIKVSQIECDSCLAGKLTRQKMPRQRHKRRFPTKPFHRVQFDILQLDPDVLNNRSGHKYIFGVIDVASGAIWFQGMKAK